MAADEPVTFSSGMRLEVTIWRADQLEQLAKITTSRSYYRATGGCESAPQRGDIEHSRPLLVFANGQWQRGVYVWTEVWHKTQYHVAQVLEPNAFKASLGDWACLRGVSHFALMLPDPRSSGPVVGHLAGLARVDFPR